MAHRQQRRRTVASVSVLAAVGILLSMLLGSGTAAGATPPPLPVPYRFLASAGAVLFNGDADPPGANNWTCRPSSDHPNPVVLVHGLLANKNDNWQTYAPLLANNGYCVFAFTYGLIPGDQPPLTLLAGRGAMETSAQELAGFVTKVLGATGAAKVDILGHSEGSIMPDYYAKFLGGSTKIERYVTLGPLWHGTDVGGAGILAFLQSTGAAKECPACLQFPPASPFITTLRSGGTPVVPGITYTNIVTKYDQLVVPYTSGIEPGMTNIVVQDQCPLDFSDHFEIVADPVGAADVLNALDPAHPRPVPCVLVLPLVGPVVGP